ncbi:MAG: lipopolysaccharide biosynthesis protein [Armatimonadota bacterium]
MMIKRVFRDSGFMMVADCAMSFVSGFVLVPLFTRSMTSDAYGTVVVVRSIGAVLLPLLFFSGSAYMRYYYRYEGEARRQFSGTILLATLTALAIAWAAALSLAPWLQQTWLTKIPLMALYWAIAIASLDTLKSYADISLRLMSRFLLLSLVTCGQLICYTVLAIWLVRQQQLGFNGWALSLVLSTAAAGLVLWLFVVRQVRLSWMGDSVRNVLTFSWPLILSQLAWFAMNRSDVLFLQRYRTLSETAVYGVAYSLGLLLMTMVGPLDKVMAPLFYRDIETEHGPLQWSRLTTIIMCGACLVATGLCVLAPVFYGILFPAQYAAGLSFLSLIVWAFVCRVFDVFFARSLLFRDKTFLIMIIQIGSAIVNLTLNYLLIPRYGAPAAAASTLISFMLNSGLLIILGRKIMPLPYEWPRLVLAVGLSVGLAIAAPLLLPSRDVSVAGIAWSVGLLTVQAAMLCVIARIPVVREVRALGRKLLARSAAA